MLDQLERIQKAHKNHEMGMNCAQSVACAFSDAVDVDEKIIFRMTEGLGRGIGEHKGNCGALLGGCVVASLMSSTGELETPPTKVKTHALAAKIFDEFVERCGSSNCYELRGLETGEPLTSCDDCILRATMITDELLFGDEEA